MESTPDECVQDDWNAQELSVLRLTLRMVLHPEGQSQTTNVDDEGDELVPPDAWNKLRRQRWARLLQKAYEVDPFKCPACGGVLHVVSVIEDPDKLRKIIEWAQAPLDPWGACGVSIRRRIYRLYRTI